MRQFGEHSRRRNCLCVLGGVFLVVLLAFSIGPPTATAVESGEHGENVTVYRASNVTFESAEAIDAAVANETVEPANEVAVGDTLVVAIESERLADAMNTSDGSNANGTANSTTTRRFFTVLSGDAEFRIIQTNPTTNANRQIALMGPENVTAHRDGTTVYAVVETGNLSFEYRRVERPTQIYGGERFAVQFGYDLPDDWSRGTVPDSPIIELYPRSELPTEQPRTTPTRTTSETATSERSTPETATAGNRSSETLTAGTPTTGERANTTRVGADGAETPGVPGFTAPTMLVALLVLAVRWTRRS